ncbi:MAG: hypothetical protein Alpg2KO_00400 [Alphaproteobacteria bacterium]
MDVEPGFQTRQVKVTKLEPAADRARRFFVFNRGFRFVIPASGRSAADPPPSYMTDAHLWLCDAPADGLGVVRWRCRMANGAPVTP